MGLCVVIAGIFMTRSAAGHTLGLSQAEFVVTPPGPVTLHVVFASAEPLAGTPLHDDDLRAFLEQGVDVTADGDRCPFSFRGSSVTETDGLALDAVYACPSDAARIEATLYYLSVLPRGHREIARIVADGASTEAVLTGDRRAVALQVPGRAGHAARARAKGRRLVALTAAFLVFMLGLFAWRWRATRRPRAS